VLQRGQSFHFHKGILSHDALIGEPEGTTLKTNTGATLLALRPTMAEFVLKMKRGAQVVYPKDIAMILLQADVFPGARVLEAGAGSGALTLGLLRAVGAEGSVVTYEIREDFAAVARANVDAYLGKAENLEIRLADVYEGIAETDLDRIVLDLPEPWRVLEHAASALRSGGILAAYLPTILQVHTLVEAMRADRGWAMISPFEALVRPWHIDGRSVRPDHRMVAHTGFITTARRIIPLPDPAEVYPSEVDPAEVYPEAGLAEADEAAEAVFRGPDSEGNPGNGPIMHEEPPIL
jgi:tRNA (adenine57-N1/adenine58-N1)-methyltransferase